MKASSKTYYLLPTWRKQLTTDKSKEIWRGPPASSEKTTTPDVPRRILSKCIYTAVVSNKWLIWKSHLRATFHLRDELLPVKYIRWRFDKVHTLAVSWSMTERTVGPAFTNRSQNVLLRNCSINLASIIILILINYNTVIKGAHDQILALQWTFVNETHKYRSNN